MEIVEYDVPGVLLGNGAENTVMIDEPCATTVQTQVSSLGFTLSSAPSANVVVTLGEMTYNASMVSTLGASEHLVLGTTSLTFTERLEHSATRHGERDSVRQSHRGENGVRVRGDLLGGFRVRGAQSRVLSDSHLRLFGIMQVDFFAEHANCTFASDQLNNTEISFPSSFTQLSSCWNVTASCGGITVASLTAAGHQPVLTEFTTLPESGAYNDITKIQRLRHYGSQWSVVDRHLAVDGGGTGRLRVHRRRRRLLSRVRLVGVHLKQHRQRWIVQRERTGAERLRAEFRHYSRRGEYV